MVAGQRHGRGLMRCYCLVAERWWKPAARGSHDPLMCATGRARPMRLLAVPGARLTYDDGRRLPVAGPSLDGSALVTASAGGFPD